MKKNLLSIIILALLIVNIVLTSIMMFSVTGASKKTAALVNDIAAVLDLELEANKANDENQVVEVAMEDMEVYELSEKLTIPCKKGEDGNGHYYIANVSLSMNTKDSGYKKYKDTLETKESLIESEIYEVFSNYTLDEVVADTEGIKKEILARIQKMFDSEFIYKVSFSGTLYQ